MTYSPEVQKMLDSPAFKAWLDEVKKQIPPVPPQHVIDLLRRSFTGKPRPDNPPTEPNTTTPHH